MGGTNTDRRFDLEQVQAKLAEEVTTLEDALAELKEQLRSNRLALPSYKAIQEPTRYAMTLEDIEEQEQEYQQFTGTSGNLFELQDVIDTLSRARATANVITSVREKYNQGALPAERSSRGEINWVALTILIAIAVYVLITR